MRNLLLTIQQDEDAECPSDWGGWKLYSRNRRHRSFGWPDGWLNDDEDGLSDGAKHMLDVGLAFNLSYYEHGLCRWSLYGGGPQCDFDTVNGAGVLVYEADADNLPKTYAERRERARLFLETYTNWANGECYGYLIEDPDGRQVESSGGYIGLDDLESALNEVLEPGDRVAVVENYLSGVVGYMGLNCKIVEAKKKVHYIFDEEEK